MSSNNDMNMNTNVDKECMVSFMKYSLITFVIIMFVCSFCSILPSLTVRCNNLYEMFTPSDTKSFKHQYIPLTAPDTDLNAPSNILFGEALLYDLTTTGNNNKYQLHIKANLYVLDGNILNFNNSNVTHSYKAYAIDNINKVYLGELKKDGDGIYKLKYSTHENIMKPNSYIVVIYEMDGKEQILLKGKV